MAADEQKGIIETLKNNWVIVIAIITLVAQWTVFNQTLQNDSERITALEVKVAKNDSAFSDINVRLASIETSLLFIKEKVK